MTVAQQLDLRKLNESNGYLVVKHGVDVNGRYGDDLLSQAHHHVELGTLTFIEKFRHRDDASWVSLFQRIEAKAPSRPDGYNQPADRRVIL
ncbi:hypothetical protein [Aureimonas altamirensis]|uniref:hypothetical protein n=1 Tax=Aureimonas altamirensis TaxID=370622 RepID=UPI00301AAAFB